VSQPPSSKTAGGIALVTAANRGIGLAIAAGLARLGYHVALSARHLDDARAAVDGLSRSQDRSLTPFQLDVADGASVFAAAHLVDERFGRLDVLVNNAAADYAVGAGCQWARWMP
jgi:NAD(P)-dependent dehydrogenase (short-subunit alcohol dehydrogenase family)